jgi:hypothetical protein
MLPFPLAGYDSDCPHVKRCDIRDRDCQRDVMSAVACMRGGGSGELPRVSVISEDEFLERIASYGAEDPQAQADAEASYALWNRGLALFELAPEGYVRDDALADSAGQTAAAYLTDTKEIVIIDRGGGLTDDRAVEIFAHEIVHALQDQDWDLMAFQRQWRTSYDSALALDAVIEGEAVHYQILTALELAGRNRDKFSWEHLYNGWNREALREAEADSAPVAFAGLRFPYAFGGSFVSQRWLAHGQAGIDALFEHPPQTTSEVLFGASASALAAERETLHDHGVPALPEPFVEVASTALGAWITRIYAAQKGATLEARLWSAQSLAADVFSVHHDEMNDAVIAAWRGRMVEGAWPGHWPGAESTTLLRTMDVFQREAALIAAETELPDADMLAWHAPGEPDEPDEESAAAAAAVGVWDSAFARPYRACAVRRPAW